MAHLVRKMAARRRAITLTRHKSPFHCQPTLPRMLYIPRWIGKKVAHGTLGDAAELNRVKKLTKHQKRGNNFAPKLLLVFFTKKSRKQLYCHHVVTNVGGRILRRSDRHPFNSASFPGYLDGHMMTTPELPWVPGLLHF